MEEVNSPRFPVLGEPAELKSTDISLIKNERKKSVFETKKLSLI